MNCEQTSQLLIEYLDGRLEPERRAEMEAHLATCAACQERRAAYGAVSSLLDEWRARGPSPGFDARLAERIEEESARTWWPAWLRPAYVAALALVLIVAGVLIWQRPGTTQAPQQAAVQKPAQTGTPAQPATQARPAQVKTKEDDDVQLLENLAVLEDAQMLEDFDILGELGPAKTKAKKKL